MYGRDFRWLHSSDVWFGKASCRSAIVKGTHTKSNKIKT